MDTTLSRPFWLNGEEIAGLVGSLFNLSIIGLLACSQVWVLAMSDEVRVASAAVQKMNVSVGRQIMEELSPELKEEKFNKSVRDKYPKAAVYDVERGVKHIKVTKYFSGRPVRINIVEADLKLGDLVIKPELASEKLNSRRTIKNIAGKSSSIVALNGTYFKPQTGVPIGTLMVDGKLMTGPMYDRVALGIFEDGFDIARVSLDAKVKSNGNIVKIDNINQQRTLSTHVLLYTPEWGTSAPRSPKYGYQVSVSDGRILSTGYSPLNIPADGYVLVGPKSKLSILEAGEKIKLNVKTSPEWKSVKHIISGGPYLVKNGEVYVDVTAQKLHSITGRNPRSAIGYTADNRLILVAVDGREGASVGLTLTELANFMKSIGCTNAINLDGGGSTVMYVKGKIVNNPKVAGGIPLSNAVVLSAK